MKTRTQRTTSRDKPIKLTPCRCGRRPKLAQQDDGIYYVECSCGVEFWLLPARLGELSRRVVADEWNKAG
jgi:hypothetical protein